MFALDLITPMMTPFAYLTYTQAAFTEYFGTYQNCNLKQRYSFQDKRGNSSIQDCCRADRIQSYLVPLLPNCFENSNVDYVSNHGPRHAPRGAPEVVPVDIPGEGLVFTMHLDEKHFQESSVCDLV